MCLQGIRFLSSAGSVSNPANTYYSAPQQLGPNGFIIGHIHMIADRIQPGPQQAPDISQKVNSESFSRMTRQILHLITCSHSPPFSNQSTDRPMQMGSLPLSWTHYLMENVCSNSALEIDLSSQGSLFSITDRLTTITSSTNHAPVIVPTASHGSVDDS